MKTKRIISSIDSNEEIEVEIVDFKLDSSTSNRTYVVMAARDRTDEAFIEYTPKDARKLARALLKAADKVEKKIERSKNANT